MTRKTFLSAVLSALGAFAGSAAFPLSVKPHCIEGLRLLSKGPFGPSIATSCNAVCKSIPRSPACTVLSRCSIRTLADDWGPNLPEDSGFRGLMAANFDIFDASWTISAPARRFDHFTLGLRNGKPRQTLG